jgi:acyl-CoA thioester hydrolase
MDYYDFDIRIRYAETDQMGVCYYANYLTWFEIGRTEYFRFLELPYTEYEKENIFLPVGEAYCRYHSPLRYDDLITIRTMVTNIKQSSIRFDYRIIKKGSDICVAEGYTKHVFVDSSMKPCRIPKNIREKVKVCSL